MTHLGDRVAALVDGQLSPEAADRATAHLVTCRPCRDLVDLERLTKARLAALNGPPPTADLVDRLLAMGGPAGPVRPRPGHVPGSPRPALVPVRSRSVGARPFAGPAARPSARPAGRPAVLAGRRRRLAVAVAGALSLMGVGVAGVAVASGGTGARPATPLIDTLLDSSARTATTGLLPGPVRPADWLGGRTGGR